MNLEKYESMGLKKKGKGSVNKNFWESEHPAIKAIKKEYTDSLYIFDVKPQAVKGVYICKHKVWKDGKNLPCGSDEFWIWQKQTRSSDEPMTTFRQCTSCGARNRE